MMRFSPPVEREGRDGERKGPVKGDSQGEEGGRSRIKVLLRSAFATAFASLLRSRGTMTNPRRHCDRPPAESEEKRKKERKTLKRNSTRAAEGRREGVHCERVGVRVRVTITRR